MSGVQADAPIRTVAEDRLGRSTLAKLIVAETLQAPTEAGFVLSLMGPWGAGKTSVLNLIEGELGDQVVVLRFDPWLFSGAEQLVTRFFAELGAQLRTSKSASVRAVADRFIDYGDASRRWYHLFSGAPAARWRPCCNGDAPLPRERG